ncbi:MAG: acyl-CoA dehydrogenase C-terminal domain-containing protein, partial [Deltaproteobacteria bacterium]|nr:acyl-CoA dehydrogenase C-terminal domain-containing protein [Deltaproteobacteria bacterium]
VISIAWQWLLQGIYVQKGLKNNPTDSEADFLQGKFYTLRFFFAYELPKIKGLEERLRNTDGLTVEMEPDHFSD